MPEARGRLRWRRRPAVRVMVAVAHVLARRPPARIRDVLVLARRGARPATAAQAEAARAAVVSVSLSCAGEGCLPRSIAAALLCRWWFGTWPTWRTGVRLHPFSAHAWIEAEGRPIGEPAGGYQATITVPPSPHY
ncbi:lasso peptide biosynthesis B2 protein [Nonomuraea sp. MG754425]|uniref:lasso peptide biosynthesis B2 protein n=1 Tax=Nonomuraea sp. MG754425 TaxID=2570319 RepID=UPI001F3104CE|nr:lasso peptide biosynthesis B2 protein [Nonomuraea sp. MG754425]